MVLSKFLRRIVVGISIVMMLLCQGTAVAGACALVATASNAATVSSPCHASGYSAANTSDNGTGGQTYCESQQASTWPAKASVPAAADLAVFMARIDQPRFAVQCTSPADYLLARAEPPPLTIVHCRLRN